MRNVPLETGWRQSPQEIEISKAATAFQARRAQIEAFFLDHLSERFDTGTLHERFGPAFRTRVSEINRNPASAIRILNKTSVAKDAHGQPCERSVYWGKRRAPADQPTNHELSESLYMKRIEEERARAIPFFAGVRG